MFVTPGSRIDLVKRALVDVWGRMKDGVLIADIVCVNTGSLSSA